MDGSSRILHNSLVFLGFLTLIGSADEFTYSYATKLREAPACMLNATISCDRVPPGTLFNDTNYWPRFTCHPDSYIDYSEKRNLTFPVMKTTFVAGRKQNLRVDTGTCQNVWYPSGSSFDPLSEELHASGCMVMKRWGCQECQMGWSTSFSGLPGADLEKRCEPLGDHDRDQFYKNPLAQIREDALASLRTCPDGFAQDLFEKGCTIKCPDHCQFCRDSQTCDLCEKGYLPTAESRHCVPMHGQCPDGYFRVLVGCVPCSSHVEGCDRCGGEGNCLKCKGKKFLVRSRYWTHCASFCPSGFFFDAKTRLCTQCPPYCKRCDENNECLECLEGLYSLREDDALKCYNQCPFGYYETNTFPFRCLPCHPSCLGCQKGPTNQHCLNCRYYGTIGRKSRLVVCTKRRPLGLENDEPSVWLKNRDSVALISKLLAFDVGEPSPIGACECSKCPTSTFGIQPNTRIGSNFFRSMQEADEYFRETVESNVSRFYEWYRPYCLKADCLKNCAPLYKYKCTEGGPDPPLDMSEQLGNFDPCPTCMDGYTKCPFSYASCVPACPSGSFRDYHQNKCILTPWPSKCEAGEWSLSTNLTDPYHFTFGDYTKDDTLMRIRCTKLQPKVKRTCNWEYEFETDDGQCRMCHSECLGCTGFGSNRCIQCLNLVHPSGHCIPSCPHPDDYSVKEVGKNVMVCNFIRKTEHHSQRNDALAFKHTYDSADLLQVTLIPTGYGLLLVLLQIASFFVTWFTDSPEDTYADLISWRYENVIALKARREFEVQWEKQSTGSMSREALKTGKDDLDGSPKLQPQPQRASHGHPPTTLSTWNRVGHGSAEWSVRKRNNLRSGKDVIIHRRPQVQRKSTTKFRPGSKEFTARSEHPVDKTQRSEEANTQRSSISHSNKLLLYTPSDLGTIDKGKTRESGEKANRSLEANKPTTPTRKVVRKGGGKTRKVHSGGPGAGRSMSGRHRHHSLDGARPPKLKSTTSGPRKRRSGLGHKGEST